jgi:hypothetical protein
MAAGPAAAPAGRTSGVTAVMACCGGFDYDGVTWRKHALACIPCCAR